MWGGKDGVIGNGMDVMRRSFLSQRNHPQLFAMQKVLPTESSEQITCQLVEKTLTLFKSRRGKACLVSGGHFVMPGLYLATASLAVICQKVTILVALVTPCRAF